MPFDLVLSRPRQDGVGGELGPVVRDDRLWLPPPYLQRGKFPGDSSPRDGRVGDGRQALPAEVVDDVEDAKTAARGHLVMDKVERPAPIDPSWGEQRRPYANRTPAAATLANHEAFLVVEPVDPVLARSLTRTPQEDEETPVAEASPFMCHVS